MVAQPPQWLASFCRSTSQPLEAWPSQLAEPALQAMVQLALRRAGVLLVEEQARVQLPQWGGSVARFTSQPLAGLPSQSAKPVAHCKTAQVPPAQRGVA